MSLFRLINSEMGVGTDRGSRLVLEVRAIIDTNLFVFLWSPPEMPNSIWSPLLCMLQEQQVVDVG